MWKIQDKDVDLIVGTDACPVSIPGLVVMSALGVTAGRKFMQAFHLFLAVLLVYIAFLIITGVYFSRRQTSSAAFWLAGRSAGVSIGFSAAASWLTAGALLAVIGFFMLLGLGSVWGFVAPNIIALCVIAFFVKKIKRLPAMTQPELLEMRYGKSLRLPVAMIITVVMILFAVSDIKGFAMVLEVFYGISPGWAAMIVGLAVAVYVTLGGLSAVLATAGSFLITSIIDAIHIATFIASASYFFALMGGFYSPEASRGEGFSKEMG